MEVKIYRSITEIEGNKWNEIVGRNRIICSYQFLLATEKSNVIDCKYFYPVIYDNDKIVAHTCVYSISMELDILATGFFKFITNKIRKLWENFLILKFIECGTPVSTGNMISFAKDINKEYALLLLIKEIENIAKNEKIKIVVFRDFNDNEIIFFNNIIKRGYKRVKNLPNTILKINWNSFDEYLEALRSHYRYKITKNLKKLTQNHIKIELYEEFSSYAECLQTLWYNVYNQAKEYKREILTKEFFENFNKYFYKKIKVIALKKDFKIIGYVLLLSDDDTLRFMFSGIDYNYNKEFSIYYNSLYYIVKQAIEEDKKEIDLGLTTYFPKMDIGAEIENLYMYLKHLNIFLNPILTNLFKILNPKIKIKTNNVFKERIENKSEKIIQ